MRYLPIFFVALVTFVLPHTAQANDLMYRYQNCGEARHDAGFRTGYSNSAIDANWGWSIAQGIEYYRINCGGGYAQGDSRGPNMVVWAGNYNYGYYTVLPFQNFQIVQRGIGNYVLWGRYTVSNY